MLFVCDVVAHGWDFPIMVFQEDSAGGESTNVLK